MFRLWITIFLLMAITLCFAGTTGKLAGKVKDENGKGLAYVNITIWENAKRISGTQSNTKGNYIISNIPPGEYTVKYQLTGHGNVTVEDVWISADLTSTQNVTMTHKKTTMKSTVVKPKVDIVISDELSGSSGTDPNLVSSSLGQLGGDIYSTSSSVKSYNAGAHQNITRVEYNTTVNKYYIEHPDTYFPCRYFIHYMPPPPPPPLNTEDYAKVIENTYKYPMSEPLSTFSIDVDTACYSNIRRMIEEHRLPERGYVRIEELLNYFKYDYPQPKDEHPFAVYTELGACPWNNKHELLHIGLQGKDVDMSKSPNANLVFLLDVSGSMADDNKLALVKESMKLLVKQLRPQDRVAIVTYSSYTGVVLQSTSGNNKSIILAAIDNLSAGGSTAGGAGIQLAYKTAGENLQREGNNRIILCTDGDFNVGESSNEAMEQLITDKRKEGIFLTVLGFGMGNIKDSKMEILADKGNGNYAYIDNLLEAHRVLVKEMGGTLFTIAKDVKLQLEFNPAKVKAYRLIGYENRIMNAEDFNNDKKDAGELGAGHTVTALYEIIPAGSVENIDEIDPLKYQEVKPPEMKLTEEATKGNELLTLKLRYKKPEADESILMTKIVNHDVVSKEETSENFRFAAAVAGYGLMLKDSKYKGEMSWSMIAELAGTAIGKDPDGYRKEFITLSEQARDLMHTNHYYEDNDYRK